MARRRAAAAAIGEGGEGLQGTGSGQAGRGLDFGEKMVLFVSRLRAQCRSAFGGTGVLLLTLGLYFEMLKISNNKWIVNLHMLCYVA
jgi:hypothetical protein